MIDDYMLDGNVDQPLWIPSNYRNFIQTYDFDKKKLQQALVIYFDIDSGYMYHLFNFTGKQCGIVAEQIEQSLGLLRNVKDIQFQSAILPVDQKKAKSYITTMCQVMKLDAFYAQGCKDLYSDSIKMTNYLEAFVDLYFAYAHASGDYDNKHIGTKDVHDKPIVQ